MRIHASSVPEENMQQCSDFETVAGNDEPRHRFNSPISQQNSLRIKIEKPSLYLQPQSKAIVYLPFYYNLFWHNSSKLARLI